MGQPRYKILFVTPGLRQGGAERQLLELVRRLPARFEPVLCLFEFEDVHYRQLLAPGEPRHVLGARRMSWKGLRKLARIIDDEKPVIVHSYRDRANFWTRMAMQVFGVRAPILVTSVRNRALLPMNVLTESVFSDFTDRVLANSLGVMRELVSWARVPPHKLEVIPNFVDLSEFRPPTVEERETARRRLDLAPEERVLILPGRLSFQKHQLGLLAALRFLRAKDRLPTDLRILLAGRARDRLYSRWVQSLVKRWGLAEQVRLLGSVSDVLGLYHAADVGVLPSLYEGMPNAVLEAQACGLPVVVSRAANADGLVVHGATGLEVPTADHQALAQALVEICALPNQRLRAMGQQGRERISTVLHNDLLLGQFVSLYDRLLAAKGLC